MGDIVKGVLGGGWSLVIGWILPTSLNTALVWFLLHPTRPLTDTAVLVIGAAGGLLLAALQTPLYRLLEGYAGWHPGSRWPYSALLSVFHRRQLARKRLLRGRVDLAELAPLEVRGPLRDELATRLAAARADPRVLRFAAADAGRGAPQLALLHEQLRRYPIDDGQVVPTRLGNAIRRLEEYGFDRFRLDTQTLWYELVAVVPQDARREVDRARTTVDFLVCLLAGHVVAAVGLAVTSLAAGGPAPASRWSLLVAAGVLLGLAAAWYRVAVVATDDWAASVRSIVNLGRVALGQQLGLRAPATLEDERAMWSAVSRLVSRPYDSRTAALDAYRSDARPPAPPRP